MGSVAQGTGASERACARHSMPRSLSGRQYGHTVMPSAVIARPARGSAAWCGRRPCGSRPCAPRPGWACRLVSASTASTQARAGAERAPRARRLPPGAPVPRWIHRCGEAASEPLADAAQALQARNCFGHVFESRSPRGWVDKEAAAGERFVMPSLAAQVSLALSPFALWPAEMS